MATASNPTVKEYPTSPAPVKRKKKRLPMLHVDSASRTVRYRTRLIRKRAAAIKFANLLQHNPRFQDAEVVTSDRANGEAWFVTYLPANPERQEALVTRMQADRVKSCLAEKDGYVWLTTPGSQYAMVTTPRSGKTYRVGAFSCTCEDNLYRCQVIGGVFCKHILAFNMRIVSEDPLSA